MAHDQSQVVLVVEQGPVEVKIKEPGIGRQLHLSLQLDQFFLPAPVCNKVRDRDDGQLVMRRKFQQFGQARHLAVVPENFADDSRRFQARLARQVHGGLGVPGPSKNAAFHGFQGEDVTGTDQIVRRAVVGQQHLNRAGAVISADACRHALARVDGLHESRAELIALIHRHHPGKPQICQSLAFHGNADQPAAVFRHEVDDVRSDVLRRGDKIAFVLPLLVVHDDDHLAAAQHIDRFAD